jgi:hypothetical protein
LTHFGHKVFSRLNKCCTEPAVSNGEGIPFQGNSYAALANRISLSPDFRRTTWLQTVTARLRGIGRRSENTVRP